MWFMMCRPIPGHAGYWADPRGHVWSRMPRGGNDKRPSYPRRLKDRPDSKGYLRADLCDGSGGSRDRLVHQLVLETFVGPRPDGCETCHYNGRRDDNRLSNLRWDTRPNNHADKLRHGTLARGERHGRAKLTRSDVLKIRQASGTHREIAERFGVAQSAVSKIKLRKTWAHIRDPPVQLDLPFT